MSDNKNYGKSTECFVHKTGKATFAVYANLKKPEEDLFCRMVADNSKFRLDINSFAEKGKGNTEHAVFNIDVDDMIYIYEMGIKAVLNDTVFQLPSGTGSKIIGAAEQNGTCPAYRLMIARTTDKTRNNPWVIQITNGRAKPKRMDNGACMEEANSFVKSVEGKVFMTDKLFLKMVHAMYDKYIAVGTAYTIQSLGLFDEVYENQRRGDYKGDLTPTVPQQAPTPQQTEVLPAEDECPFLPPNGDMSSGSFFDAAYVPEQVPPQQALPEPVPQQTQAPPQTPPEKYDVTAVISSDFTAVSGVYLAEIVVKGKKYDVYFKNVTPVLDTARKTGTPVRLSLTAKMVNGVQKLFCKPETA